MPAGDHITELQAVDIALGGVLAAAYEGLGETGPENYKRFCRRPSMEKIYRTQVDSPRELVSKIAGSKKGQGVAAIPPTNGEHSPDLPVLAYYRKPGMTNGEVYANVVEKIMYNDALTKPFRLTFCPVALDYTLMIAAWDKPTLDMVQIGYYAHTVRFFRKGTQFVVPYILDGERFEITATVTSPKSVLYSDASMQTDEGRLYAVTTGVTVATNVLVGQEITVPDPLRVHGITRDYIFHGPKEWVPGAI